MKKPIYDILFYKEAKAMEKFVPREKLSKKARKALDNSRRRTWGSLSPVTRRSKNPKAYKRKKVVYGPDDHTQPF